MNTENINDNKNNLLINIVIYIMLFFAIILSIYYTKELLNDIKKDKGTVLLLNEIVEIKQTIMLLQTQKENISKEEIVKVIHEAALNKDINGNMINYYSNTVLEKGEQGINLSIANIPKKQCSYLVNNLYTFMDKKVIINDKKLSMNLTEIQSKTIPKDYKSFFNTSKNENKEILEKNISKACDNNTNNITFYGI